MGDDQVAFGRAAELVRDIVQPSEAHGLPYIGLEHIEQETLKLTGWGSASDVSSAKFRFRKGDILLGKLRPYFRKVVRAPFDGICSTDIWVVRAKNGFDQGYLFYWMAAKDFVDFASGGSEGTRMPRAKWEYVARFTRPRISLPEQRAIAHILGTLDDKIELNRRMHETLEAMAQALFKSWFVDFDPVVVNAIKAGNPIPEKFADRAAHYHDNPDALGLPEDLLRLFPARFVDSELGPIPEGWEVKAFADTVEIICGGTPKTSVAEYWSGDIPWFSVADASSKHQIWVIDTEKKITHAGLDNSSTKILPVGTTIITARGTVGRIALVSVPMAMNQSCYGLRGKRGGSEFLNYFQTRQLVSVLQQKTHGSVFDTITRKTLATVSIVVPPSLVAGKFEDHVGAIMEWIRQAAIESRTLAALRDVLLPKLISGELRVPNVEKILEDAQ